MARIYHNKPLIDGSEEFRVRVMPKDIRRATPREPSSCAIAQGLLRSKEVQSVRVGACYVYVEFKDRVERYELSTEDKKKVRAFDKAIYFEPSTYYLQPPKKKLGARRGESPGSNVREGKVKNVLKAEPLRHL